MYKPTDQLRGKVAIITGASGGLGKGMAEVFAAEGAKTVVAARRKEALEQVAGGIRARGGEALVVPTDVTREAQVTALFTSTMEAYGRVDILVNNAGMPTRTPIEDTTLADWQAVIDLNLTAPFLCAREAVRIMKKQGGGRIINIGSISAITPRRHSAGYAATKAAIEGLTRSLTLDGRDYGVVASVIHPGATASSFNAARGGAGPGKTPADYIMSTEDLARVALLMCSLPPEVNLFEATLLPNNMVSFIGRG
jgi:NAD(P)-dependent dehydrogenase (short-subunit alcohol dehydrogenase family)